MGNNNFNLLPVLLFEIDIGLTRIKIIIASLAMSLAFPFIVFWHPRSTYFSKETFCDKEKYVYFFVTKRNIS